MRSEQIEEQLAALRTRREEIAGERAEAEKAVAEARSALVNGSASSTDAVKGAQGELTALTETVEAMDAELERGAQALERAREREERAEKIDRLEELADAAAEHRQAFKEEREALAELIEEHGGEMAEALHRWRSAHGSFMRLFLQLAPGMNTARVLSVRNSNRERAEEMEAEREELAETLRERGADFDAAMPARFTHHLDMKPRGRGASRRQPTREQRLVNEILKAFRNDPDKKGA